MVPLLLTKLLLAYPSWAHSQFWYKVVGLTQAIETSEAAEGRARQFHCASSLFPIKLARNQA